MKETYGTYHTCTHTERQLLEGYKRILRKNSEWCAREMEKGTGFLEANSNRGCV